MAVNFYTVIGKHPSIGFKKTNKISVDRAQFGDGYVQRTVSGLNTNQQDYQVSFRNQDLATAQKIIDFLGLVLQTHDDVFNLFIGFNFRSPNEVAAFSLACWRNFLTRFNSVSNML